MRSKHGLYADRFTIIVSAGGFGVGKIEPPVRSLAEMKTRAQVVAICGRNVDLLERTERLAKSELNSETVVFHPIGFTSEMDELMSAADMIVGKPGGLTTSEALAKGLIFCIVNPIPGQEERNSDHLLEKGCAIKCNNLSVLAHKIDALASDPIRLKQMRESVSAEAEEQLFHKTHPKSHELYQRARKSLHGGVPMLWMIRWAGSFPVFVKSAKGARFTDVDGNEYIDFCLGDTGAMTGHSPDATVNAINEQIQKGITLML